MATITKLLSRSTAGFLQRFFAAQTNLALPIDFENLDHHLVALFEYVANFAHAFRGKLRDVHQAIRAGQDLNEGAELDDLAHRAFVNLADLRLGSDTLDHLDRFPRRFLVRRSDGHAAIVLHVHFDAGRFDDAADHLATRTDDLS